MVEIRFHGRGGQGAVIASEMLAAMYFESGKHVQAFPAFGVERRGAPVLAFTRVDDDPIEIHYGIYRPDHLIILDPTLVEVVDVTSGLKRDGLIVLNTGREKSLYSSLSSFRLFTIDVNKIAIKYGLGTPSFPIVNTAILGAYAAISGNLPIELVEKVIFRSVPVKKQANARAARDAFTAVKEHEA